MTMAIIKQARWGQALPAFSPVEGSFQRAGAHLVTRESRQVAHKNVPPYGQFRNLALGASKAILAKAHL